MTTNILIAINAAVFILTAVLSQNFINNNVNVLINLGAITQTSAFYTIFTYMFLHGGLIHLVMNMFALNSYGKMSEILFKKFYLFLYLISGIISGLAVWFTTTKPTIGASGAICGLIGANFIYHLLKKTPYIKGIAFDVIILIAISFIPFVSWIGHLAGFLAGSLIMVLILNIKKNELPRTQ